MSEVGTYGLDLGMGFEYEGRNQPDGFDDPIASRLPQDETLTLLSNSTFTFTHPAVEKNRFRFYHESYDPIDIFALPDPTPLEILISDLHFHF